MARQPKPKHQKIADALKDAKVAANGGHIFQMKKLARAKGKLLLDAGWLLEIYAGWVALVTPGARNGDTIPFFSNYWEFVKKYLDERLAKDYVLSATSSLALHADSFAIPQQLAVTTTRTTQGLVKLQHSINIMVISDPHYDLSGVVELAGGLRALSIERSLAAMSAAAYRLPTLAVINLT